MITWIQLRRLVLSTEAKPERDPRVGDVWRKKFKGQYFASRGYIEREIVQVGDCGRGWTNEIKYYDRERRRYRFCLIPAFHRWAAGATVVRRGED